MTTLTVRISEKLLNQLDNNAHFLHVARAEYVRRAIEQMNNIILHQEKERKLKEVSLKVRKESMRVNAEFSKVERDPKT